MRNINFIEVGMENYGPYTDELILSFENDKLVLITGPNGIGKTMSLDAIPFTLYGTTSKGAKGDDVVNNLVEKNCKTWVKLTVDNDIYLITRYHKYTKFNNTVIINQNGVDIKQGHKECLPFIERLICPQKAFMNALMFGQKVKDFFTDLDDSKKKEIFRKVLDLEMFLTYYKFADQAGKDVNDQLTQLNNDIQIKTGLLNDSIQQISLLKQSRNNFENEKIEKVKLKQKSIDESNRLLDQWKKFVEDHKNDNINLEETITKLSQVESKLVDLANVYKKKFDELDSEKKTKILELKQVAQKLVTEIKDKYHSTLIELQDKRNNLKEKLSNFISECQGEKHKYEIELNGYEMEISTVQSKIDEIIHNVIEAEISQCPTCEQEVSYTTIELLKSRIPIYKNEIEEYNKRIEECKKSMDLINKKMIEQTERSHIDIDGVENEIRSCKRAENEELNHTQLKLEVAIQQVELRSIDQNSKIVKESNDKSKELEAEKCKLTNLKKEQQELITKIQNAEQNIRNIQSDIRQADINIKELNETSYDETQLNNYTKKEIDYTHTINNSKQKLYSLEKIQKVAAFWKTGFSSSGIPSMLIDEAVPYMNERVTYYLDMLTNGRYIVSFDTLAETKAGEFRDKISVHVLDTQTRANTRVQLSGGQIRIIDIAIILTLGDLLSTIQDVKFNILLFDEIFDALDEQNIQYVCKVLSKLKIGKSIYIISHQHQDHLESDETLTFT